MLGITVAGTTPVERDMDVMSKSVGDWLLLGDLAVVVSGSGV